MNIKNILSAILLCGAMISQAQSVFVSSSTGNDNNNGQSWVTAKRTLPAALAVLVDSTGAGSGNIFVKVGDYQIADELLIPAGVTVRGGYRADSEGSDTSDRRFPGVNSHWTDTTYCTIISGAGNHRIARVYGVIEGCVVRNGYTDYIGGGLLVDGGTARHCVIKECDAIDPLDATAQGGGLYVRNNAYLLNCVVTDNRADDGAAVAGSGSTLINNTITNNTPLGCGPVQDYDGNVYKTVVIGDQCWMRENLRTTHYNDGTLIPLYVSGNNSDAPYRFDGYYSYMSADILQQYGLLYNGYVVKGLVPFSSTNVYNMLMTDWDTITTCGSLIFDDGGENGYYSANCNGYLVILPGEEGQKLSISGTYNTESCCDRLIIYDGIGTDNQLGSYGGEGAFNVTSTSGPLTLRFYSNGGSQYWGFRAEVKCGADVQPYLNVCPNGWHVPTDAEWTQLTNYVGSQPKYRCQNNTAYITKALAANYGWNSENYTRCYVGYQQSTLNNATWFSANPTGYWESNSYNSFKYTACMWSSTQNGSNNDFWQREIYYAAREMGRNSRNLRYGFSVRCLKDE